MRGPAPAGLLSGAAPNAKHVATLDPWPQPPELEAARRYRNWAFESAALDLALCRAGRALRDVLGLEPQPVRFVTSLGLGDQPSIEHVRRRTSASVTEKVRITDKIRRF